jgi:GT2 family glycosyltransferase
MKVSIIIPYKVDRGWLKDAIESVDQNNYQLILSQGEGNWPTNFNKGLKEATGDYIKYLHEDDMLSFYGIKDSVEAIESQKVDFIHGDVVELNNGTEKLWKPSIKIPTFKSLLQHNTIHSASLMYRKEIFEKIGGFNESDKCKSFEELEFNLRVLKAGFKIGYCDSVIAFYRRHPKQIIRTVDKESRKKNRQELINSYA